MAMVTVLLLFLSSYAARGKRFSLRLLEAPAQYPCAEIARRQLRFSFK